MRKSTLPPSPDPDPFDPGPDSPGAPLDEGPAMVLRHTLRILLNGHINELLIDVTPEASERVLRVIQEAAGKTFLLIEGTRETVAVRLEDVALVHFLWDASLPPDPLLEEDLEESEEIQIYLRGREAPVSLQVEPDGDGEDEDDTPLSAFLCLLDASEGEAGATHYLEDLDGEPVVIVEGNLSMVRVPNTLHLMG